MKYAWKHGYKTEYEFSPNLWFVFFFFFFIPEIQENELNTLHLTPHDDRLVDRSRCFPGYICV